MAINYNQTGVTYNSASYQYDGTSLSNDKSGTVSGSSTTSGTVVGREGSYGTVYGTSTTSGTVVGREGATGTASGTSTTSGTVAGREGSFGTVTGTSTTSGSAIGSGGNQTAGGGVGDGVSAYLEAAMRRPRARRQEPRRIPVHKLGGVSGRTRTRGFAQGTRELTLDDDEALMLVGAL